MTLPLYLSATTNWRQLLLVAPVHPGLPVELPAFLKSEAKAFMETVSPEIPRGHHLALNAWYGSNTGQQTLAAFARALWLDMAEMSAHAMPAHDARHAMYKVPATALQYMASEDAQGWVRIGILGGLLHDYGRWAEERLYGEPLESVIHARLSFVLGRELLGRFEMPDLIKQQILLSAIRHTTGATPEDPMPLKLTVAADRDQLYGPEIILRIAHHMVNASGDLSSFYGEKPGMSVLDRLQNFLVKRIPGPLFSRQAHVDQLRETLLTFILLCESATDSQKRFARMASKDENFDWELHWRVAQDIRPAALKRRPADTLELLLDAPHTAPYEGYRREARGKVSAVPAAKEAYLTTALTFANDQRRRQDRYQLAALKRIAADNPDDLLVQAMTEMLVSGWRGTGQGV